jgi:hypothetical protein
MTRRDVVFAVLGGFLLTNAVVAEIIGGKLILIGEPTWKLGPLGPFEMSVGIIPWPVVFVTTDLINEYFGRRGVRRLSFLAAGMIAYAFVVIFLTMLPAASPSSPVDDASYRKVLGQSLWIIVGSITAFLVSQLVDVVVFHFVRRRTGKALLWMRATGSTVVSQLIDSLVVLYIGLAVPLGWSAQTYFSVSATNYTMKLLVALAMTPLVYAGHRAVEAYLGRDEAERLAEEAARESGAVVEARRGG